MTAPLTQQHALSPLHGLSGSSLRASQSKNAKVARLECTQKLNEFMPRLQGKCVFHFVEKEQLIPNHFPSCHYMKDSGDYLAFRKSFKFPGGFEYCYSCGVPQD